MRQFLLILILLIPVVLFSQSKVGINTTVPAHILDIRSPGEDVNPDLQLATPEAGHFMRLFAGRDGDPKPFVLYHADDTFRIATSLPDFSNFTERISIIPSGNVGIGIGLPASKLHIHDPALFQLPPPFQGYFGNKTYVRVTNGATGSGIGDGLLLGVGASGSGELSHPYDLSISAGLSRVQLFADIVTVDSNLWVSKNVYLPALADTEDLNLLVGVDGYLKTGPIVGADTDWTETDTTVYNNTKFIGIGTAVPAAPLMVVGPASTGTKGAFHVYNQSVTGIPPFEITSSHLMVFDGNSVDVTATGPSNPDLKLQAISAGSIEMVQGGGNVGVGGNAPISRKMRVTGPAIPPNQNINEAEGTLSILNLDQTSSEMLFDGNQIETVDEVLKFNAISPHNIILADGGGNVGIGVTPNSKLTIEGPDNNGTIAGLEIRSAGNGQILLMDGNEIDATGSFTTLALNSNSGGSVTIGTLTPATGYKLSVAGKVIAEEVRCQLETAWPDYVFNESYPLMPLDDLAAKIAQQKHLPGIPPASEIDVHGVDLGNMQVRMMEKIEELTLYILQLNERIAELENGQKH